MSEDKDLKATEAVVEMVENEKETTPEEELLIPLSTGVVLRAKPMPPGTFMELSIAIRKPEIPKEKVKGKDIYLTNPDEPNYIERMKSWKQEQNALMLRGMIIKGTEYVSGPTKAKGKPYMKDEWIEELIVMGLPTMPQYESWRYIAWVLNEACVTDKDFSMIFTKVGRLSGVAEEDIQKAANFSERE